MLLRITINQRDIRYDGICYHLWESDRDPITDACSSSSLTSISVRTAWNFLKHFTMFSSSSREYWKEKEKGYLSVPVGSLLGKQGL